jgi:hypothetical protein
VRCICTSMLSEAMSRSGVAIPVRFVIVPQHQVGVQDGP